MDRKEVESLLNNCRLPGDCRDPALIETHISWIVLTGEFGFKIKRPVTYSFLDFSTLEKRRHFCHRELKLNRRLAPEMYLRVIPVTRSMVTGNRDHQEVIDHAVQMKRMDNAREMDKLLKKGDVTDHDIDKLAQKIAGFHQRTRVINTVFEPSDFAEQYEDILQSAEYLAEKFGKEILEKIHYCIEKSESFIREYHGFIRERTAQGYRRDCHGDLNSRNIFLYDDPVIFDCIEFNEEFRHIDVINEIAFLVVDLDFFNRSHLAERFTRQYLERTGMACDRDLNRLFNYYKSFRANVRAKVTLLSAKQDERKVNENDIKKYLDLMVGYTKNFS